jgi:hypothetical protein
MASELSSAQQARWASRGVRMLSGRSGTSALGMLLQSDLTEAAVFDVDWGRFVDVPSEAPAFFEALLSGAQANSVRSSSAPASARQTARLPNPATASREEIEAFCDDAVAASLGVPPGSLDRDRAIRELGFDSLMALETRNRLQREASVSVPVVRLLDGSSIRDLARFVGDEARRASIPATAADAVTPEEARALLARLAELTDEDVETLLVRLQPRT